MTIEDAVGPILIVAFLAGMLAEALWPREVQPSRKLWRLLGIDGVELQLNTIGSAEERRAFRGQLIAYFERYESILDEDARRRLHALGDTRRAARAQAARPDLDTRRAARDLRPAQGDDPRRGLPRPARARPGRRAVPERLGRFR